MQEKEVKGNPLIPLMNEGLGELRCRRHFLAPKNNCKGDISLWQRAKPKK